jgi:hypothetical protein
MTSSSPIERRIQNGVPNKVSDDAKPACWLLDAAATDGAGRLDHVAGHFDFSKISVSVTPDPVSRSGVNAAAASPPAPGAAAAINSGPKHFPPASQTAGASAPALSFENDVAALEARWARDGIIRNAIAFRVAVSNEIIPMSSA